MLSSKVFEQLGNNGAEVFVVYLVLFMIKLNYIKFLTRSMATVLVSSDSMSLLVFTTKTSIKNLFTFKAGNIR